MTKRDVVAIVLKVLGVIAVMYAILHISSVGMAIGLLFRPSTPDSPSYLSYWYIVVTITTPILLCIMAYLLLKWGDSIAIRLVRKDKKIPALGTNEWQRIIFTMALRIIGVVCLVKGIPEVIEGLGQIAFQWGWYGMINYWTGFFSAIVLVILGLYLISGGKYLVNYVFRERKTKPSDE